MNAPTKPTAPAPHWNGIHPELIALPQWVLWNYELDGDRWTKRPKRQNARAASSTDRATWSPFADGRAAFERGGFDGVGFVTSPDDRYVLIDLDHVTDPDTGELASWAAPILDAARREGAYIERSPSGTGFHIIGYGPQGFKGHKRHDAEIYCSARFFTITGDSEQMPDALGELVGTMQLVRARIDADPEAPPAKPAATSTTTASDAKLIERARRASNGAKFSTLFDGNADGYESGSEADLALANMLAFWFGPNPERVESIMRSSGLRREKWDTLRDGVTYLRMTVDKALEGRTDFYESRVRQQPRNGSSASGTPGSDEGSQGSDAQGNTDNTDGGISDDALAQAFTTRHRDDLRYCAKWAAWLCWDGKRWEPDDRLRAFDAARALCRDVLADQLENEDLKDRERNALRHRLGAAQTVAAVLKLASSDPAHAVVVDQLDADPWALNTPGGIVDLRTGTLRPHDPVALHTKITAAAPAADCPRWLEVLARVLPDPEVRDYVQRLAGYALTGLSTEHVLPFFYGTGRNGKSVIANALRRTLGDYAVEIAPDVLMESHHEQHPTHVAVLRGARFVVASEIDSGRRWNESRMKRLTGGDPISARYMRGDLFEFEPTHTLLIVGNQKPGLRVVDEAMRARIHLIGFEVTIPEAERDPRLPEALEAEYGGILGWALDGCLKWQARGLAAPAAIRAATDAYLEGEDSIRQWIAECCKPAGQITLSAAYRSYREWCEPNAVHPLGRNAFSDQLESHGYRRRAERKQSPTFDGLSLPFGEDRRYAA